MAVTSFDTINGRIVGQSVNGVQTNFLTDASGNVTSTVNSSAQIQNTYRYKPSGALLAKTGVDEDPRFTWHGSEGYRTSPDVQQSEEYVRMRHYSEANGSWTSVDPFWPVDAPYSYCEGNPTSLSDPSGAFSLRPTSFVQPWAHNCHGRYWAPVEIVGIPQRQGFIIQHIRETLRLDSCLKRGVPVPDDYYEAWCVINAGGVFRLAVGDCNFQVDAQYDLWLSDRQSEKGKLTTKGDMVFIPGTPKDFKKYFRVGNVKRAGRLLSARKYPFFPKKVDVKQSVDFSWSCCCPPGSKKKVCEKSFSRQPSATAVFDNDCR